MMVMIAKRHAQNFFCLLLFNDKAIEITFYLPGLFIEEKRFLVRFGRHGFRRRSGVSLQERGGTGGLKMLPHKLGKLFLKFFRRGRTAENFSDHRLSLMTKDGDAQGRESEGCGPGLI